jgi:ElaB/YqjD/DUF883 family membrane-anchored ribosome-binding protein
MNTPANDLAAGDEKREVLREKIETAQARQAQRSLGGYARDARDNATVFVREHPIATVGAALAFGVVLAAVIPGPGRRLSQRVGKKIGGSASSIAAIASEMGLAYAAGFMDNAGKAARTGKDTLEDISDTLGDSACAVRREASNRAAKAADGAGTLSRNVKKKTSRAVRDLRSRVS